MLRIVERKEIIEIQYYMPVGQRVLFLLLSFFPLLALYELIIRPNWQSYLNVYFMFAAVISIGAMTVSAFPVWAAIAGLNSKLKFDKADGIMTYSEGAPIVRWHTHKIPIKTAWGRATVTYCKI